MSEANLNNFSDNQSVEEMFAFDLNAECLGCGDTLINCLCGHDLLPLDLFDVDRALLTASLEENDNYNPFDAGVF